MVADVPVGAFLSGGVDSSVVVALMQRAQPADRSSTFTVGFADRAFDESADAAAVAAHLGTDHTSLPVDRRRRRSTSSPDCPRSGTSRSPTSPRSRRCLVSRLARTQVTVSLSGDGGDELFAGYNRHAWLDRLWRRARALPDPVLGGWPVRPWRRAPRVGGRGGPGHGAPGRHGRCAIRRPRWRRWAGCSPPSDPEDAYRSLIVALGRRRVAGASARRTVTGRLGPPEPSPAAVAGITEQMLLARPGAATSPTTS